MQQDSVKVRQLYAEVTGTQHRLLKQKEQVDAFANDWYWAQFTLSKNEESYSRETLSRRQVCLKVQLDTSANLHKQIETQSASIDNRYENIRKEVP